ncbi:MAG: type II toxin-antitoxin system RelE/ParE family toxin [Candidatus Aminicenantes bacterium]|nr:type II toxin-antitoxin system RelE/ParE family toxin [Candidatus Aminicenantes bacterium]
MKKVLFYRTEDGKCPVENFLDALTDKQTKKVAWVLRVIRDIYPIPAQYFKKLVNTGDLWEVRVTMGNNIFRFLGFFDGRDFIVLTNGFQKKSRKTPKAEITLAEERRREYLNRRKKNG